MTLRENSLEIKHVSASSARYSRNIPKRRKTLQLELYPVLNLLIRVDNIKDYYHTYVLFHLRSGPSAQHTANPSFVSSCEKQSISQERLKRARRNESFCLFITFFKNAHSFCWCHNVQTLTDDNKNIGLFLERNYLGSNKNVN